MPGVRWYFGVAGWRLVAPFVAAPGTGCGGWRGHREVLARERLGCGHGRTRGRRSRSGSGELLAPATAELAGAADRHPGPMGLQRSIAQARTDVQQRRRED